MNHSLATQVKELIGVTSPYYALENLQWMGPNWLQCDVWVQNLSPDEASLISAAEAIQHLTILGSCALALQHPVVAKHYYLATEAHLDRVNSAPLRVATSATRLLCRAQVLLLTPKIGKVHTRILTIEGEEIFELEVSYTLLKASIFQKLFNRHYQEVLNDFPDHLFSQALPIEQFDLGGMVVTGELGVVQAAICAGHFDQYPALLVAALSASMLQLGHLHLNHLLRNQHVKYVTKAVALSSTQLAFVGEQLLVRSRFLDAHRRNYTFSVNAYNAAGQDFGKVVVTFERVEN